MVVIAAKVYGKDEWHQEKHDVPARRTWRKLHLAIDEHHQVIACELTTPEVGDPSAVADLLAQIVTPFKAFIGDGAYDGEPVSQAVLNHQPNVQVVIPPHKTAVLSTAGDMQRDHHIEIIAQQGRLAWQRITGYNLRNYAELAMQRYKRIFGNIMKARAATAENRDMGQCVCTEPDDQSRYADVRESLKSSRYRRAFLDVFFIQQRHPHARGELESRRRGRNISAAP